MIVDEIHAVADDKRGSHLALTLARLDALVAARREPQRIGLSATVKPDRGGGARSSATRAPIVNVGHRREMDLRSKFRSDELGAVATQRDVGRDLRPRSPS